MDKQLFNKYLNKLRFNMSKYKLFNYRILFVYCLWAILMQPPLHIALSAIAFFFYLPIVWRWFKKGKVYQPYTPLSWNLLFLFIHTGIHQLFQPNWEYGILILIVGLITYFSFIGSDKFKCNFICYCGNKDLEDVRTGSKNLGSMIEKRWGFMQCKHCKAKSKKIEVLGFSCSIP